jgi:hypothetical protein
MPLLGRCVRLEVGPEVPLAVQLFIAWLLVGANTRLL